MKAKTFVLSNPRTFRRGVRIFIKGVDGKMSDRLCEFSTEHLIRSEQRNTKGRSVPAEYTTDKPAELEALFRDSAYGKNFYLKGDAEGKLKKPTIIVSKEDLDMVALKGLFVLQGLQFDDTKTYDVLLREYEIHLKGLAGANTLGKSTAHRIPTDAEDLQATLMEKVNEANDAYEVKYGEIIPNEIRGHQKYFTLLDGLMQPGFDGKAFVAEILAEIADNKPEETVENNDSTQANSDDTNYEAMDKEQLLSSYYKKFNKNVANVKKNDLAWIRAELTKE